MLRYKNLIIILIFYIILLPIKMNEQLWHIHGIPVLMPCELDCTKEYKITLKFDTDNNVWVFVVEEV